MSPPAVNLCELFVRPIAYEMHVSSLLACTSSVRDDN